MYKYSLVNTFIWSTHVDFQNILPSSLHHHTPLPTRTTENYEIQGIWALSNKKRKKASWPGRQWFIHSSGRNSTCSGMTAAQCAGRILLQGKDSVGRQGQRRESFSYNFNYFFLLNVWLTWKDYLTIEIIFGCFFILNFCSCIVNT